MAGEGKDVTNPTLDIDDFIGQVLHHRPDGKLYQLPDQQFANLYWFRYDWFTDPKNKAEFKAKYGYDLGVPVNWSAYEDIAEFFTNDVKEIDGKIYGHMDYGKKDPSLGWRFTDAWLSMAGNGDKGMPERPAGRRMGHPRRRELPSGRLVRRARRRHQRPGRGLRDRQVSRLAEEVRAAGAQGMTFSESGPVPAQGKIAQQMFWYTAFTADMVKPGLPV
jgi:glycerol transport system substrate-binding protein